MTESSDKPAQETVHQRVDAVISVIRPLIQGDGGDIELIAVGDDGVVQVRLHGACVGCPGAQMTLKMGVERHLKEKVPEVTEVVCV
jgi:Fe-S cluster biogenesis protein NfuA